MRDNARPSRSRGTRATHRHQAQNDVTAKLLGLDNKLTSKLAVCASKDSSMGHLRPTMKLLEYSMHGIPWLICTAIGILVSHQLSTHEKLLNLFMGLVFDLLVSFVLKTTFQRPRPAHNQEDMFGTVSVDRFSFPSGHATRAGMLTALLLIKFQFSPQVATLIVIWTSSVCFSRVVLGRHHVSDVIFGALIGLLQYYVLANYLWLSSETCEKLIRPIQEELHL